MFDRHPEDSPASPSAPDAGSGRFVLRRKLLIGAGTLLGTATAAGVASLRAVRVPAADRFPTWHPQCSGFHGNERLIVRQERPGVPRHIELVGFHTRIWCLCAGTLSEAAMVTKLGEEELLREFQLQRFVLSFLDSMYSEGFLVPSPNGDHQARELEYPAGLSEKVCPRPIG